MERIRNPARFRSLKQDEAKADIGQSISGPLSRERYRGNLIADNFDLIIIRIGRCQDTVATEVAAAMAAAEGKEKKALSAGFVFASRL